MKQVIIILVVILILVSISFLTVFVLPSFNWNRTPPTPGTNLHMANFQDFYNNLNGPLPNRTWKEVINTGNYDDTMYYNLFNNLFYNFLHSSDSIKCVQNKETWNCFYAYIILNQKEDLCNDFPPEGSMTLCSGSGPTGPHCGNVTIFYRDSCIGNTRMYGKYLNAPDKLSFCDSFTRDFIKKNCQLYTCRSYYSEPNIRPKQCDNFTDQYFYGS